MKSDSETPLLKRWFHPLHKKVETSFHPLRYLFLEITSRCNLNCLHCGSDCGKNESPNHLSVAEWKQVIDHIAASFNIPEVFLVITGGEPLCHPELSEILTHITKHGFRFGLVSNGYTLTQEKLNELLRLKMVSMTISLDGLEKQHDWLRGKKGSFQHAVAAIEMLSESNIPIYDVVTCAHPGMLNQLANMEALLRRIGVKRWRLFSIFPKGRAAQNRNLILNPSQLRQLIAFISNRRKKLRGSGFQLDFCCEGFLPAAIDAQIRTEPYFCRAGINIGSILIDGSVAACPNISPSLNKGNVRQTDFATLWENEYQVFRDRGWMKTGPCEHCRHWKNCLGNSMHLWDNETGHTCICHTAAVTESKAFF